MANDPRISGIIDGGNLPNVADSDILSSLLLSLEGTPVEFKDINPKLLLNKIIASEARAPADADLISGLTRIFRNTVNSFIYLSIEGAAWELISTPPTLIWEASSTRVTAVSSTTTYSLNAGHSLSDYDVFTIVYDNNHSGTGSGSRLLSSSLPYSGWADNGARWILQTLYTDDLGYRQIKRESDTSFSIPTGSSSPAIGIRQLYGKKG